MMANGKIRARRVVIVNWKDKKENPFEVFSNLKILCSSYPQYNYNTLNNYLSKNKMAYENDNVRIERKVVQTKSVQRRKMAMVVRRFDRRKYDEKAANLKFWLGRPEQERLAAVTSLSAQLKKPGQKMDRTHVVKAK